MSHVATVNVQMTSIDALVKACKQLGLEFVLNQTTYKWFGQWVNDYSAEDAAYLNGIKPEDYGKCLHAIRNPGDPDGYEIGLLAHPSGKGFLPVVDFWGMSTNKNHIAHVVGRDCRKLIQEYSAQVTIAHSKHLIAAGYKMQRQVLDNGTLNLVFEK